MSAPYIPLYVADYLGDTQHLTIEQSGCYLHLLMAMWRAGGALPDDPAKLARMVRLTPAKWAKVGPDVLAFFEAADGLLTNRRITKELEKYQRTSDARSDAGRRGADAKQRKSLDAATANAPSLLKPGQSNSEPEPEPTEESTRSQGAPEPTLAAQNREAQIAAGDALASMAVCPGIASLAPLRSLLTADPPCDWAADVLPAIESAAAWHRSRDGPGSMRSWTTARKIALENRDRRLAPVPIEPRHERPDPTSAKRQQREANYARAFAAS